MKIRYYSDVHLEFGGNVTSLARCVGEDVVVMAGDIEIATLGIEFAQTALSDRPVIYVLGNHEFYGQDWDDLIDRCRRLARGTNVHFLERDSVVLSGVRFLGCTLWTDMQCHGPMMQSRCMEEARRLMNDYRLIQCRSEGTAQISPRHSIARFQESVAWLDREISESKEPVVVVTHHAPTRAGENPEFAHALSSAAFYSNADHLIRPPVKAWIFGHSHYSCKVEVNGIPVVSNQRGYPGEHLASSFDPGAMLVIEPSAKLILEEHFES